MKSWQLFVAGILVGAALALVVLGLPGKRAGAAGEEQWETARDGTRLTGPGTGREGSPRGRDRKGRGWGHVVKGPAHAGNVEEIMGYLRKLALVDDFEEINLMELLRQGHFVTALTEQQVTELLGTMREDAPPGDELEELHEIFQALLFARLAELNGPEAMRKVLAGEFGEAFQGNEEELTAIGVSSWVDADPDGAAAWFREAAQGTAQARELLESDDVQQAFFAAMARHDPKRAMDLAREAGAEVAEDAMEVIARYEQTTEGLREMLAATDGEAQEDVFEVMTTRDPKAAVAWLDAQEDLADRDGYVASAGRALLNGGDPGAVEWYMSQELSSAGEADRYDAIVDSLADRDLAEASAWLTEQADTPARDQAEISLARHFAGQNDETASFAWASEVGNRERKLETVQWLLERGWDRGEGSMKPEVAQAARETGFGAELEVFLAHQRESE